MTPKLEVFHVDGKTLYRIRTAGNSKRMVFDAEELTSLGSQIQTVLRGTDHARAT